MTASIPKCMISRHEAPGKAEKEREGEREREITQIMALIAFSGNHGTFYSSRSVWGCIIDEKSEA